MGLSTCFVFYWYINEGCIERKKHSIQRTCKSKRPGLSSNWNVQTSIECKITLVVHKEMVTGLATAPASY